MTNQKQQDDGQSAGQTQNNGKKADISLDDLQQKIQQLEQEDDKKEEGAMQAATEQSEAQKKVEELTAALARAMADLQNFRRRTEQERLKWMQVAHIDLLKNILPIVDNFDRCSTHLPEALKNDEWAKGVLRIHDDLASTLKKLGVERIPTVGQKIDPLLHEALRSGPGEKDVILEEYESGYTLEGTVIKPAKVSVGNGEISEKIIDNKN